MSTTTVEAAGGVVWRRRNGAIELLAVHRPRYDDWSFAKGKLDPGETHEEAAVREVEEEAGVRCSLGPELSSMYYDDRHRRPKRVRYWLMEITTGEFSPNDEVDEVAWLAPDEARRRLTYERDRALVDEAVAALT